MAGATLDGFSLEPDNSAHILKLNLNNPIQSSQFGNITEFKQIKAKVEEFRPEIIFHLAAQPLVRKSFTDTRETYATNFMGGVNLLDSLRDAEFLKAVVFVTSDKAYENLEWEWGYRETDQMGGFDPYSASKGAVELAFASFRRSILASEKFQMSSVRAGNVIGGGDWSEDRIVPDVIRAVSSGQAVQIRNPRSTRPWQHVLEPLSGYLRLAELMLESEFVSKDSYNFGPSFERPHTVAEVVGELIDVLGFGKMEVTEAPNHLHEATFLQLNCDRAKGHLGWNPRWNFSKTMLETGTWYKSMLAGEDLNSRTETQILDYFEELN